MDRPTLEARLAECQRERDLRIKHGHGYPASKSDDWLERDIAWLTAVIAAAQPAAPVAKPAGDASDKLERALSELVDKIVPGLDSGDILADARTASKAIDTPAGDAPSVETLAQRNEVCDAWAALPAHWKSHPAMQRLYRALGGITLAAAKPDCYVCGTPHASHGTYPTFATHPYSEDGRCGAVGSVAVGGSFTGHPCPGSACINGCALAAAQPAAPTGERTT